MNPDFNAALLAEANEDEETRHISREQVYHQLQGVAQAFPELAILFGRAAYYVRTEKIDE